MNKDTLILLQVIVFFTFIFGLFSCSKDSDLVTDYQLSEGIQVVQNKNDSTQVHVTVPLKSPFPYCQSDSNPIGGGSGYTAILTPSDATIYIKTFNSITDFKNTIESAPEGSIIYIDDALSIDLTGLYTQTGSASIRVPAAVTIASGRGIGLGAHIYTNDYGNWDSAVEESKPLFWVNGNDVRFTGIRLQGPTQEIGSATEKSQIKIRTAIAIIGYDGLEIDNCELYGWPFASIQIGGENTSGSFRNNKIHHNSINNNRQLSLGYGAVIYNGYADISSNIFMANRHDIAGSGQSGSGYEASCNLILSGGIGHNFDMHAEGPQDSTPNAGSFVFIHHNDFEDVGTNRYNAQGKDNIIIRGRPEIQCRIENNRFKHANPNAAIRQINSFGGYGNMLVWNNIYQEKNYIGWYVRKQWIKSNASNFVNLKSSNDDLMKSPESGSDYQYDYAFGDYDGDGNTDIYKLENGMLYTLPLNATSSGPSTPWRPILRTAHTFKSLCFGFYDGDDHTDIVMQEENTISISSGANSPWRPLLNTTYKLAAMRSGDFDGNGIQDLFLSIGNKWMVSHDSNANWQTINTSTANPNNLKLGYFNSIKKSDVLKIEASHLMVSFDGTSDWTTFGSTTFNAADLEIADFDGDNLSDVIQFKLAQVLINGDSTWQQCQTDNFPIASFPYGDF